MKVPFKRRLGGQFITALILLAITAGLLLFRITTLLPGFGRNELRLASPATYLHALADQPLHPLPLIARTATAVVSRHDGLLVSRAPNIMLALLTAGLLYWLLKQWYGFRLALFGSLLIVTAPWFLHAGRLANNDIGFSLATVVVLVLAALWHRAKRPVWLLYVSAPVPALILGTPGMVWLLAALVVFERKNILASIRTGGHHSLAAGLVGVAALVPYGIMLSQQTAVYMTLLGLPAQWQDPLRYVAGVPLSWLHLFGGGYYDPERNLGGLPIVNTLTSVCFLAGLFLYARHPKATRTRLLATLWMICTLLIALGTVPYSVITPLIMVLAVGGLGYLLHLWLRVFPRNPLARSFGIGMVAIVVLFAVSYNLAEYFIAWPRNPATQAAFRRQP